MEDDACHFAEGFACFGHRFAVCVKMVLAVLVNLAEEAGVWVVWGAAGRDVHGFVAPGVSCKCVEGEQFLMIADVGGEIAYDVRAVLNVVLGAVWRKNSYVFKFFGCVHFVFVFVCSECDFVDFLSQSFHGIFVF